MKRMIDYIPESINFDVDGTYNKIWEDVYNKRKKVVSEDLAVHSANAIVYAEVLKDFRKNKWHKNNYYSYLKHSFRD
jgi:hypothetical protein